MSAVKKFVLVFLVSALMAGSIHADEDLKVEYADFILDKTKVYKNIEFIPDLIKLLSNTRDATDEEKEINGIFLNALNHTFDLEEAKKLVLEDVVRLNSESELKLAVDWISSPLGKKMLEMADAEYSESFQSSMVEYIDKMRDMPPSKKRQELIAEGMRLSGVVDKTVDTTKKILSGILRGKKLLTPQLKEISDVEYEKRIQQAMDDMGYKLSKVVHEEISLRHLYIYRNISDEDLEKNIDFMKTDAGKRFNVIFSSMNKLYDEVINNVLTKIKSDLASIQS